MEAKEASDLIEAALSEALPSLDDYEEGDMIVDWVLIAHTSNPDKEKGGAYPTFVSNGLMPDYKLQGLLKMGIWENEIGRFISRPDEGDV